MPRYKARHRRPKPRLERGVVRATFIGMIALPLATLFLVASCGGDNGVENPNDKGANYETTYDVVHTMPDGRLVDCVLSHEIAISCDFANARPPAK